MLVPDTALALQMPPSWPLRTSSASMDSGAASADSTARKLKKAATRAHPDKGGRAEGQWDTARL